MLNKLKLESSLILLVLALIWGTSFILIKKGLVTYSAPQVASMRILFAGIIFIPFVIKYFKEIPWDKFKYIFLFGLFELGIPPFLYSFAQLHVDSSTAGILNSLVPLFTLALGLIIFKLKYHWLTISGVFVGLIGAFLITFMNGSSSINFTNAWGLLIVFATLLYGMAGQILNLHLNDVKSIIITALAFVSQAIPAGIYLFSTNFVSISLNQPEHLHSFMAIVILAIFGSALAIYLFSKLVQLSNALFASFVTYLIPFVSFLWGWLDGENINIIHFISLFIIFFGIFIAHKGEKVNSTQSLP